MLSLNRHDTTYIYQSDYIEDVSQFPFVNNKWELFASNDSKFSILDSLDLVSNLQLTDNREYTVDWYISPKNLFGNNKKMGVYGIVRDSTIYFKIIILDMTIHRVFRGYKMNYLFKIY